MKSILFSISFFLLTIYSIAAQNGKVISFLSDSLSITPDSLLYDLASLQKPPGFPGGQVAWVEYMGKIAKQASFLPDGGFSAEVTMMFVVEKDGSLSNKRVIRNRGPLLHIVLELIDQMPRWIPAMKDGQAVRVWYLLPVRVSVE